MLRSPVLYFLLLVFALSCKADDIYYKNYNKPLANIIVELSISANRISILIDKSDYKLTILADSIIVKEYPVVLGGNPVDDKLMQGDECTPEGTFSIISKYPHSSWSKFIWINYPTDESWTKHNKAKNEGLIPMDAKIGGEIGIHGVPNNLSMVVDLKYNWTLGCISLKNKDINEIYPYITESTVIVIQR